MTDCLVEDRLTRRALDSADTYEQWLSFIERHIFEYRLSQSLPRERSFHFDAKARTHNGWSIGRVSTRLGRVQLSRGPAEIRRAAQGRYAAYVSVTGEIEFDQFHRNCRLVPQFVTLISGTECLNQRKPSSNNDTVVFTMPSEFVHQHLVRVEQVCARPSSAAHGVGQLAHQSILTLQQTSGMMGASEFESAARMVGELILLAFERAKDMPLNNRSVRASTLARLKSKIQARLTDPDLQLSDVASECGISLSYLHSIFRDGELTAWEYLKSERLQRARRQLELASVNGSTVTDVALACGFSNVSHFSTAFKGAFSVSPREVLHALRRDKTNS